MNTTVNALLDLYVKLGGSLTDTYPNIADGASVGNYTTIPDCIEACTQMAGSGGGSGVIAYDSPSTLPVAAADGTVAVALNGDATPIEFPSEVSEDTDVEIGAVNMSIGNPTHNENAIDAVIAATESSENLNVKLTDDKDTVTIPFVTYPVVTDLENNDYTDAGCVIDPEGEDVFLADECTKKYCVVLDMTDSDFALVPESKIEHIGNNVSVPYFAIFAFENLTGTISQIPNISLTQGWNILCGVYDTDDWQEAEPIGFRVINNVDVNEFLTYETTADTKTTLSSTAQAQLYDGVLLAEGDAGAGLYVMLHGSWNHCAID